MINFALTNEDKATAAWAKLVRHWEDRLASLRAQNDGDRTAEETAHLRGKIAEVKRNLTFDQNAPILD